MKNKTNYNKLLNLSHKTDYYLTNSYEDNFENQNNEWNNDNCDKYNDFTFHTHISLQTLV